VARTTPPISPASINIEKNRLLGFDPSNAIGIIDKIKSLGNISASYPSTPYFSGLPIASSHISILAGAEDEDSQINTPGTAAQTKIVRIISQTAVFFSTIIQFTFICLYKFSNQDRKLDTLVFRCW
jgi:hypothetical protein